MISLDKFRDKCLIVDGLLQGSLDQMAHTFAEIDDEILAYLLRRGIWDTLIRLLSEEMRLYQELRGAVDKKVLESFRRLVREDLRPKGAKLVTASMLDTYREPVEVRVAVRKLVRDHWGFFDRMKDVIASYPTEVKGHLDTIRTHLTKLKWLTEIFVCYARQDKEVVDHFVRCAEGELENKHIWLWRDKEKIKIGDIFSAKIENAVKNLDMGIVFVSKAFDESVFIGQKELPALLEKRTKAGMRIAPIFVERMPAKWKMPEWLSITHFEPTGTNIKDDYTTKAAQRSLYKKIVKQVGVVMEELSDPKRFHEWKREKAI